MKVNYSKSQGMGRDLTFSAIRIHDPECSMDCDCMCSASPGLGDIMPVLERTLAGDRPEGRERALMADLHLALGAALDAAEIAPDEGGEG